MGTEMEKDGWLHDLYMLLCAMGRNVRRFRLSRDFLTFLVFFFVSVLLWGFISLRETRSVPVEYKLVIKGVPDKVVFTSDVPQTVTLYIRGRGFSFIEYVLQKGPKRTLILNYAQLEKSTGRFTLDMKVWKAALENELIAGLVLDNSLPYVLDVYFSLGYHKRVPVYFKGHVDTSSQYLLTDAMLLPDSVDVYAPIAMLDTITAIYTTDTVFADVEHDIECNLPLSVQRGVKCLPDSARFMARVDLFTEKTLEVPIYSENIPQNKVLRTFPQRAMVKFHVSMALFDSISAEDFLVLVDYNSITPTTERARLKLTQSPTNVSHVSLQPEDVEFVIEQFSE